MILVNTTFCVDARISEAFIEFITQTYLPLSDSCGLHSALLTEMRAPAEKDINGNEQRTFALQMRAPSQKVLDEFRADVLPHIYNLIGKQWGQSVGLFESILDVIHDPSKQ